jgi:two-component system, OmpR family, sensor kinase
MVSKDSLSGRLTRTLILWFCAIWLLSVAAVGWHIHDRVSAELDGEMVESGGRMLDIAGHEYEEFIEHGKPLDATQAVLPPLPNTAPVTFQLVTADERVFVRSESAPEKPFPVPLTAGFKDTGDWRIYTVEHPTLPTFLHLGVRLSERNKVLRETIIGLALPMLLAMPLLAWIMSSVARRELRVVGQLEHEISLRGGDNLQRLALVGMPKELQSVGDQVNDLLHRLSHALDVERTLAAHAAHELRTPLATASLRLTTALGGNLQRSDVEAAFDAVQLLRRRTERLLQLSRAESASAVTFRATDLLAVAAAVAQDFWGSLEDKSQLNFFAPTTALTPVMGDLDALSIALRNLVENALRHGNGARVEIEVIAPSTLAVRDFGAGIDEERLSLLRQRHVRQVSSRAGFGLGLSIVKTIVEKHHAELFLTSPLPGRTSGFEARIVFPAPNAATVAQPLHTHSSAKSTYRAVSIAKA